MTPSPPLRVIALTKRSPDYGQHASYYTQAFAYAPEDRVRVSVIAPRSGWPPRVAGRVFSACIGAPRRNQAEAAAELSFLVRSRLARSAVSHIANVEDHLPLLAALRRPQPRWVATVHFPPAQWREKDALNLRHCGKVIVLCRRDEAHFSALLGADRVVRLLHGVDTEFFFPDEAQRSPTPRIIFVGKWLRDFSTTAAVLHAVLSRWPALHADLVIARRWTAGTPLAALEAHPRVHWHEAVDDEELRRLYRRAWLLLLPLLETSANNALVEAMACGTVPIANDVGGVRDYGGGDVFPMVPDRDPAAFLALMASYLGDPKRITRYGQACRDFALTHLDWRIIRAQHLGLYEQLAAESTLSMQNDK